MARKPYWQGGVDAPQAGESLGRLQVFRMMGESGNFRLVHEVEGITCGRASKVKRPVDAVGSWQSRVGRDLVLLCRDPALLGHFKTWRATL